MSGQPSRSAAAHFFFSIYAHNTIVYITIAISYFFLQYLLGCFRAAYFLFSCFFFVFLCCFFVIVCFVLFRFPALFSFPYFYLHVFFLPFSALLLSFSFLTHIFDALLFFRASPSTSCFVPFFFFNDFFFRAFLHSSPFFFCTGHNSSQLTSLHHFFVVLYQQVEL